MLSKFWRAFQRKDLWFQSFGEYFEIENSSFKTLASFSNKKTVLSKYWRAFQYKKQCFQNFGKYFEEENKPFKMLASISMKRLTSLLPCPVFYLSLRTRNINRIFRKKFAL
jgi:hypothetical protein